MTPLWPSGLEIHLKKERIIWGGFPRFDWAGPPGAKKILLPDALTHTSWGERLFGLTFGKTRGLAVMQLIAEGFPVDVPIDLWGWDAAKVMALRWRYGYTWVPTAQMASIQVAPGLSMPGQVGYDPEAPPIGAILVPPPEALL